MTTPTAQDAYDAAKAAAAAIRTAAILAADALAVTDPAAQYVGHAKANRAYIATCARAYTVFAAAHEEPEGGPFGHNDNGNITFGDRHYAASSLGTTPLGLDRARAFAAWLNACAAELLADKSNA